MRRSIIVIMVLSVALWIACSSSDDETPPTGPTDTRDRVYAYVTTSVPTMDSVNDTLWDSATVYTLDLNGSGAVISKIAAAPSSIELQVIKTNDKLFCRYVWDDSDHSQRMDYCHVHVVVVDYLPDFNSNIGVFFEDQLLMMFDGVAGSGYDTWNWRALTTAPLGLAGGATYYPDGDSLIPDLSTRIIADTIRNPDHRLEFVHKSGPAFAGQMVLFKEDAIQSPYLDSTHWVWVQDTYFPKWMLDREVAEAAKADVSERRWDILAVSEYDADLNQYTLVMCRDLNTGDDGDLNMAGLDSLMAYVGAVDDRTVLGNSSSSAQRFSDEFVIKFTQATK